MSDIKKTSLHDFHKSKNAKMIDFAGWSMPFSYDGTLKEHNYVRESAGYFDVSHMGRLRLNYSQIEEINYLICSDLKNISNTKALYSIFTSEDGTAIDDVIFFMEDIVDDKNVIIIDDVLFTGRTVRSAMEGIMNFGRPNKIELLVLIDRKYTRDIPVEPTYCGIKINTITSDRIEVNLAEQGFDKDNIWIINK